MRTNNVFAVITGFWLTVQLASMATPGRLDPYENLDPYPPDKPRSPLALPEGCDTLLSLGCKVTSSDPDPVIGELAYITDGNKNRDYGSFVELKHGLQWIQIDLGEEKEIHAICIYHYIVLLSDQRAYRDVVCQISNDPKFAGGVVTVFNNDHDNSTGLGIGKDKEYIESPYGRPFIVDAVRGRYVRCYSNGYMMRSGTSSLGNVFRLQNHYTEVEVYGRPIDREQEEVGKTGELPPIETDKPTSPKTTPWKILLLVGVIVTSGIVTASHYFRRKRA